MYEGEAGFESVTAYVHKWNKDMGALAGSKSHLEHLLLTVGMISRDIYGYQFSSDDPDDDDRCPPYCHNSSFNVQYHETLMKLLAEVHTEAKKVFEAQGISESLASILISLLNFRWPHSLNQ